MQERRLKVELLERRLLLASDFGDAPAPYDTLQADGGAEHNAIGPTLGATRDTESDGTPSPNADGDGADEGGVTFGTIQVGALDATVTVNVQGGPGKLDAWIDFNGDGSWGGPGERIFPSHDVFVGDNLLTFDVPSYAVAGTTYARFRLSTAGGLGASGLAADGEVEDYAVTISDPLMAEGVIGDQNTITSTADGANSVFAADVDGDGDMDVLSASISDDTIAWYENDGSENFVHHAISTTAGGAQSAVAVDVDGDGDLDVLGASVSGDAIAWYENDGSQNFSAHTISTTANAVRGVFSADVDGDGDLDVLSASYFDDKIAWYENDGNQIFVEHAISTTANGAVDVFAADVDSDGDLDVLSAAFDDGDIYWYENDGFQNFTTHRIFDSTGGPTSVYAADLDGDGDLDVLYSLSSFDRIGWLENNGNLHFTPHVIDWTVLGARSVIAADVDGDGDLDAVSASRDDDTIAWYENDGNQNFTEHTISNTTDGARSVFVADVDSDGYLDVLSATFHDDTVQWYRQITHFYEFTLPTFSVIEGDSSNTTNVIQVTRSGEPDVASSVDVFLFDGTATAGSDFTTGPITVNFSVGESTKSVPIEVLGDTLVEYHETINLSLANPSNDTAIGVTQPTAVLIILNDDPADFGDAPAPYPTIYSEAGALHIANGPNLGATRDTEVDGVHSSAADADSTDEDGVNFGTIQVGALDATVTVNVQGGVGKLDAWIDFNGDGSWSGLGEQIFAAHPVALGDNLLEFDVPSWAASGTTYARFRLSTNGELGMGGAAPDGEVEDYAVSIVPPVVGGSFYPPKMISSSANGANSVFAGDIDGDGDVDVVSTSRHDDKLSWYENQDGQSFTEHVVSTAFMDPTRVSVADMDGDGDLDFLIVSGVLDNIAWLENDGTQNFSLHMIAESAPFVSDVTVADVDEDGDLDVVSKHSSGGASIAWYENDGDENFTFQAGASSDFFVDLLSIDVDGDGDQDELTFSSSQDKIEWLENDGTGSITTHIISTNIDNPSSLFAADIDEDGDLDVLATSFNEDSILWYENTFEATLVTTGGTSSEDLEQPLEFEFQIGGPRPLDTTLTFQVFGLATLGVDYSLAGFDSLTGNLGTVVIPEGQTSVEIVATPFNDSLVELDETLQLRLLEDAEYFTNSLGSAVWTITSEELGGDFGDAPGPFPTLIAEDGAAHSQGSPSSPRLGSNVDFELDGQPTPSADGDGIDDDGVTFSEFRVGQVDATAIVEVQNAPSGARLDAWFDFNGDGSWQGVGEQIANSLEVSEGENIVEFAIPTDIIAGARYARFRLSTAGGLEPTGIAADGEVEDYLVEIKPPRPAIGILPNGHSINSTQGEVRSLFAVDLDKDLDNDIVAAAGDAVVWFENDSTGNFTENVVIDTALHATSVKALDLDGDGDFDLISASRNDSTVAWYENDGSQNFTEHVLSSGVGLASAVEVTDLDGDGDLDIVAVEEFGNVIWFVNDGNQNFFSMFLFNSGSDVNDPFAIHAVDLESDGDLDLVVSGDGENGRAVWYENDGSQEFFERPVWSSNSQYTSSIPVDLNNDGDLDLLGVDFHTVNVDSVVLFEQLGPGGSTFQPINFSREVVSGQAEGIDEPRKVTPADVDGDGDWDILLTSAYGDTLSVLVNDGIQNYERIPIYTAPDSSQDYEFNAVIVADLDGDGDLDVVSAPEFGNQILWFESVPDGVVATPLQEQIVEDTAGNSEVVFSRIGDVTSSMTVAFDVTGTAAFGTDYTVAGANTFTATTGNVTFLAGESTASLFITTIPDADFELDETVVLRIADITDYPGIIPIADDPIQAVVTIVHDEPQDFGDAPDTYQTLVASGGAEHGASGPTLGATRDVDSDGQPSANADGDGADDDGVSTLSLRVGQQDAIVTVNVQNAPVDARLHAWFDFDGDGNWLGAWEQVATNFSVIEGDNAVPIDIPAWAQSGMVHARFRLSTAGGLSSMGHAVDGEVEDYVFEITPPKAGGGFATRNPVDSAADGSRSVSPIDMDGDGDIDIVSAWSTGRMVVWYENDGSENFTRHTIDATTGLAVALLTLDADRDGDIDVLVGTTAFSEDLLLYENDGTQNFTQIVLDTSLTRGEVLAASDLNRDGNLDIAISGGPFGSSTSGVRWLEYHSPGVYEEHLLTTHIDRPFSLALADFDGNGTVDIVTQQQSEVAPNDSLFLFQNDGLGNFTPIEIIYFPTLVRLSATDLDSDGDQDVILTSFNGFNVLINDGTGQFTYESFGPTSDSHSTNFPADVDGDGDMDVLTTSGFDDNILWKENPGNVQGMFSANTVAANFDGAHWVAPADIDGDGDIDAVGAAEFDDLVSWFENIPQNAGDFDNNGRVDGIDFLLQQQNYGKPNAARSEGDANGDGSIDSLDISHWSGTYGYTEPPPSIPGDFDENGSANGLDFLKWQIGLGSEYDATDLLIWEANYPSALHIGLAGDQNNDKIVDGLNFPTRQIGFGTTYDAKDLVEWELNYESSTSGVLASEASVVGIRETAVPSASDPDFEANEASMSHASLESSLPRRKLVDVAIFWDSSKALRASGLSQDNELKDTLNLDHLYEGPQLRNESTNAFGIYDDDVPITEYIQREESTESDGSWESEFDQAITEEFTSTNRHSV